jgi:hypothetical protein
MNSRPWKSYEVARARGARVNLKIVAYALLYVIAVLRARGSRPKIFYEPDKPRHHHSLYQVGRLLGCRGTTRPTTNSALVVSFEDATIRDISPELAELSRRSTVVNAGSVDISKQAVEGLFIKVFGRSTFVDPACFRGQCVRKSDANATHDGEIVSCPRPAEPGFVYQRLIDNSTGPDCFLDIRVPVVGRSVPFVYLKRRLPAARFSEYTKCDLVMTEAALTRAEVDQVLALSRLAGLDYGELDVLRDATDGLIYVVDVNNTPSTPHGMGWRGHLEAVVKLSVEFKAEFLDGSR